MLTLCVGSSVHLEGTGRHLGHDVPHLFIVIWNLKVSGNQTPRHRDILTSLIEFDI